MTHPSHVTVVAPVCAPACVLAPFLRGLEQLDPGGARLDFVLIDDNVETASSSLMAAWASQRPVQILAAPPRTEAYRCDERMHHWTPTLIERVAEHKDRAIEVALRGGCDAVFFVDADLLVHPSTLVVLGRADVDVVAEVFWTHFTEDQRTQLPNVWASDQYSMAPATLASAPDSERDKAAGEFLARLLLPGLHPVGGLGACTLVRRRVLDAGVRFAALPNVSWLGEDRHFCIRAAAHGFELWADTHLPPVHLYRGADLHALTRIQEEQARLTSRWDVIDSLRGEAMRACTDNSSALLQQLAPVDRMRLAAHLDGGAAAEITIRPNVVRGVTSHADGTREATVEVDLSLGRSWRSAVAVALKVEPEAPRRRRPRVVSTRPHLTLAMVVRNESDRYLAEVVERVLPAVDAAVIIDDASSDDTPEICAELLRSIPHEIIRLERSLFAEEHELRGLQWRSVLAAKPQWVLNLDADELLEAGAADLLREQLDAEAELIAFRLFDMWDREHYRDDSLWTAHKRWWPLLARLDRPTVGHHPFRAQHCPRWPLDVLWRPCFASPLRIQHLGWSRPEDRLAKHERYLRLDPRGQWGDPRQVASILDAKPNLVRFDDAPAQREARVC